MPDVTSNVNFVSKAVFAFFVAVAPSAPILYGDVVFSNIDSVVFEGGEPIVNLTGATGSYAEAFTPNADYILTGAQARLFADGGGTVAFSLFSNDNGVPGSMLGGLGSVTLSQFEEGVFSANTPTGTVILSAGDEYWLVLNPDVFGTFVAWEYAGSIPVPAAKTSDPSGMTGWQATSLPNILQFEIDGTPYAISTPEPSNVGLCLVALGLGVLRFLSSRSMRQRPS